MLGHRTVRWRSDNRSTTSFGEVGIYTHPPPLVEVAASSSVHIRSEA